MRSRGNQVLCNLVTRQRSTRQPRNRNRIGTPLALTTINVRLPSLRQGTTIVPSAAALAEPPPAGHRRGHVCVREAPARHHRRQDFHPLPAQRQLPRRAEPDARRALADESDAGAAGGPDRRAHAVPAKPAERGLLYFDRYAAE